MQAGICRIEMMMRGGMCSMMMEDMPVCDALRMRI